MGEAGLAEMNMHIQRAGNDMTPRGIHHLSSRRHGCIVTHRDDAALIHCHCAQLQPFRRDQRAAGNHQIHGPARRNAHRLALLREWAAAMASATANRSHCAA